MLWEAVPTALAAAFSPWTLLIVAGLLSRPRPMPHALVFLATAATITVAVGILVIEVLTSTGIDNSHKHSTAPPALDVAFGLVILISAAFLWHRPPHEAKTAQKREVGLLAVIVLGMVAGSPSALYMTSLHSIAKGRPSLADAVLDVLLIAALVLLLAEVPIALYAVAPERTAAVLKAANDWLARHGRFLVVIVAGVVGCYFVVSGLAHLV
jgi:hypothetical protein